MRRLLNLLPLALLAACGQPPPDARIEIHVPAALGSQGSSLTAKYRVTIRPRAASNLCITAGKGEHLVLAECDEGEGQIWSRWGSEIRGGADKCMAIEGDERDGARLVLADCVHSGGKDQWVFAEDTLKFGAHNDKCIDVVEAHYAPGTELQIWSCVEHDEAQAFGWVWALEKMAAAPDQPVGKPEAAPAKEPTKPPAAKKPEEHLQQPAAVHPAEPAKPAPKPEAQHPLQAPSAAQSGTFGPAPAGTLVAPYFYAWESPGCVRWLADAKKKAGLAAATMAFGLSGGGCKVAGFADYASDIKAFQAGGGTVVLSFGGESGTYLQTTCQNVEQLAEAILGESKARNSKLLDFDVEGKNLDDKAANQRLASALALVQQKQPGTYVSFTLPVDPTAGVPGSAVSLLQMAAKAGVKVSRVNIMAMDYGIKPKGGQCVGDLAISAAQATGRQMKKVWPNASQAEINHAIGITPMIGTNDGNSDGPFLVSDAQKVAAWAKQNGIGHLAYWAFQRDVKASGDYNDHSQHQDADFAYYKAFSGK